MHSVTIIRGSAYASNYDNSMAAAIVVLICHFKNNWKCDATIESMHRVTIIRGSACASN